MILNGEGEIQAPENLQIATQQAMLTNIITEEPETETWPNQEYAEQAIGRELRNTAKRKEHGSDGIPGEEYEAERKWTIAHIARIMNKINELQSIHGNWANGAILYIYKNKGDPAECGNYRPICITQIYTKYGTG